MRSYSLLLALALSVVAGSVACGAEDTTDDPSSRSGLGVLDARKLQANDVSILFPLAKTRRDFEAGYLTPSAIGPRGELLPSDTYERAFGEPGVHGPGGTPPAPLAKELRLVSVRFDPCFAGSVPNDPACENQVRLVFQTLRFDDRDGTVAEDDAVHVFYRITRAELTTALARIVQLRGERTPAGPLAVHPVLAQEGLTGAFGQRLGGIIQGLCGEQNLVRITHFVSGAFGRAWTFSGVEVDRNGGITPMTIPGVAPSSRVIGFFAGIDGKLSGAGAFSAPSTAPAQDDLRLLGNFEDARLASENARQMARRALDRIEDPKIHSPKTTDCTSCHTAEPIRKNFDGSYTRGSAWEDIDLHMFSYKGQTASIHARTVKETASIVSYLAR